MKIRPRSGICANFKKPPINHAPEFIITNQTNNKKEMGSGGPTSSKPPNNKRQTSMQFIGISLETEMGLTNKDEEFKLDPIKDRKNFFRRLR